MFPDPSGAPLPPSADNLTVAQVLQQAVTHHREGRLIDAECLYQAILEAAPAQPDALHNMGLIQMQCSNPAAAVPWFRAALEAQPDNAQCWMSLAEALLDNRQPDEARQVILAGRSAGLAGTEVDLLEARILPAWMAQPDVATLRLLIEAGEYEEALAQAQGQVARFGEAPGLVDVMAELLPVLGRDLEALPWLEKCCAVRSQDIAAWRAHGAALQRLGRCEDAYRVYLQALALQPSNAETLLCLADNLRAADYVEEAWVWLSLAALVNTSTWAEWDELVAFLSRYGLTHDAQRIYAEARVHLHPPRGEEAGRLLIALQSGLAARPKNVRRRVATCPSAEEYNRLRTQVAEGRLDELGAMARGLCERHPLDSLGWKALGVVLKVRDKNFEQALTAMRLSVAAAPDDAEAHTNLAALLAAMSLFEEAEWVARAAIRIEPGRALAYAQLGTALQKQARSSEAVENFRKALELNPNLHDVRAGLQFSQHFSEHSTPDEILLRAKEYARRVQVREDKRFSNWLCSSNPTRLRVGFVSGDLRKHPVGFFASGLFEHIDRSRIELYAYVTNPVADALTERIRPCFDSWVEVDQMGDEALAQRIHQDGVHVLIDLSGFTAYNRLPAFTYKPAPVQASWLGYFATTGLPQMDYFIGDPWVTPVGDEHHFVEKIWRLPETFCCMARVDTGDEVEIAPGKMPALTNGYVTFGSFNKLSKMNDPVVALWSRILRQLPEAKLLLNAGELATEASRNETRSRFARHGIEADRLILRDWNRPRAEHLGMFREVDIALDPFPYMGGTTSFEALWMGVPVLTMKGDRFLSRLGESINFNAGLSEWIASGPEDYAARAMMWANDLGRLARQRENLREKIIASPLFDMKRFSGHFLEALWGMWEQCPVNKLRR